MMKLFVEDHQAEPTDLDVIDVLLFNISIENQREDHIVKDVDVYHIVRRWQNISYYSIHLKLVHPQIFHYLP